MTSYARFRWWCVGGLVLALACACWGAAPAHAAAGCTATPGGVTKTRSGDVRAAAVPISCSGAWTAEESLLYLEDKAFQPFGKWSYGGDLTTTGVGSTTLPAFTRAYHEGCARWKLRVELNGRVFDGPVSHFCN